MMNDCLSVKSLTLRTLKMKTLLVTGATLLALMVSPALAQSTETGSQTQSRTNLQNQAGTASQSQSGSQGNTGSLADVTAVQKIKEDLQNAGFTDVKIIADSFVIQAKSKNGYPVLMTIGPHGMSIFEAMEGGSGGSSSNNTTEQSSASSTGSSTTGANTSGAANSQGTGASAVQSDKMTTGAGTSEGSANESRK